MWAAWAKPRDRNPDACYTVNDREGGKIDICRVEYDIERTQEEIRTQGLPVELAEPWHTAVARRRQADSPQRFEFQIKASGWDFVALDWVLCPRPQHISTGRVFHSSGWCFCALRMLRCGS